MTHKDDSHDASAGDDAPTSSWWLVGTALLVIAAWGWSGYLIHAGFDEPSDRGTFGDMFGAVNALFSGLAFSVLIYTMILQRIELKLQRKELRETRAELAGQKEQMEIQNSTMRRQRFEQTYFNLLDLFSSSSKSLELEIAHEFDDGEIHNEIVAGRSCFSYLITMLLDTQIKAPANQSLSIDYESIVTWTADSFEPRNTILSQYNAVLEQTIRFIHFSELSEEEKDSYAALLQSMLSQHEKALLFYFGLSAYGKVKLKPYIERYALLTSLQPHSVIPAPALGYYHPHAFGNGTPE